MGLADDVTRLFNHYFDLVRCFLVFANFGVCCLKEVGYFFNLLSHYCNIMEFILDFLKDVINVVSESRMGQRLW